MFHRKTLKSTEVFVFRPLEARLELEDDTSKIHPYCKVQIGLHSGKTHESNFNGSNPTWPETILLERKHGEKTAKISIRNKTKNLHKHKIGKAKIDLSEIKSQGKVVKWYSLEKGRKSTADILIEAEYVTQAF